MKQNLIVFIIILLISSLSAEWVDIDQNRGDELFDHTSYGKELTEIHFSLPGYDIEPVTENGVTYQKISYWNEGEMLEVGMPDLPIFTRLIAIPNSGTPNIEILSFEEETISNMLIYPQQELQSESQANRTDFVINSGFYDSGDIYPSQMYSLGEPAIMRGLRVVGVTINPFRYDPQTKELKVITNIDVIVSTEGRGGVNEVRREMKLSRAFEPLYQATVLNYESTLSREDNFQNPSYLIIYINYTAITDELEAFVNWKHQKGFVVDTYGVASGTSYSTIKNYIQTAYDTWENPPEFVCLIGDAEGIFDIPVEYSGSGGGDHPYSLLEGNDIVADVYMGRLSISSETDLQTMVYKIFHYEKEPYLTQTNWYQKAVLAGDPSSSGTSTIDTKQHVKAMMLQHNPDYTFNEYYTGGYSYGMSSSINSGVSYLNYRGFMGMSGFTVSSISGLNNGYMLPVAVFPTCGTGTFYSGTSRSEEFLRVGSPGSPKGAIAAYGTATSSTHTCFNNCIDAGTYYGIFADQIFNMGGALTRGKLNLYLNYPNQPSYAQNFCYWNTLIGDPGMDIWTDIPQPLTATYDSQIYLGANTMLVHVEDDNGQPLEDAWVTALLGDDDIFATGWTDANGDIILEINAEDAGTASLTVTKHNYIPHLGSVDVGQADRFVNIFEYEVDDDNVGDSSGNDDGIINPGETIEFNISLKNSGTSAATNVTAVLSTPDDYITITDDIEDYGAIAGGVSVYSADDFDFSVDPDVLGGMDIHLELTISDDLGNTWVDFLSVPVEGAVLEVSDYDFPDDPNGMLEPGETAELVLTLLNPGTVGANDVYGQLFVDEDWFTLNDDEGYFGNITGGGQATNNTNRFEITAASQIISGSQFVMEVELYNTDGYDNRVYFTITVGEASITDPLGPDAYGYYCYDDEDVNYYIVPTYDWIEINNIGTNLDLNDPGETGDTEVIDNLPITFKFYGIEYDELLVCSNGWIQPGIIPGELSNTSFMNWKIPGPLGPSPQIAVFWDDLETANGDVYYYYDSAQNYLVIEWDDLRNEYNPNLEETFQVIIYDSNFYPTATGDSEMKFQYKVFNNVDVGSYPSRHGQYCTVGIEDHTGTRGLEYTYNNTYPPQAKVITNETALLITGPPIQFQEPFIVLGVVTLNDFNGNGQADYGESVNLDIMLNNLGIQTATGVSGIISTSDTNVTITQDSANFADIVGNASSTNLAPFSFDVAEDCPDGHVVPFTINVTTTQGPWELYFTVELNAPVIEFHSIYIDDGANNILDPGETTDFYVSFENSGGSDAYELLTTLVENDPYIELNSTTHTFTIMEAGSIGTAMFNVTASSTAPIGHMAETDWDMTGSLNYAANGMFYIIISQIPVLMDEDFSGTFPPDGWSITGGSNWQQNIGNYAGGISPEAEFYWSPSTVGTQRLICMPLNTAGSLSLDLSFQHYLNHYSGSNMYSIKVQTTSDGNTWNDAWSVTPSDDIGPETLNLSITTPDVGSTTFQLAYVFDGDSWSVNNWFVDNVHLEGSQGAQLGFIDGTITLSGGSGSVEDVVVSAGGFSASPVASGYYMIPLPEAIYDMTAELDGYATGIEENVSVMVGQTTTVDFTLSALEAPENLNADVSTNDVFLEWEMPTTEILIRRNQITKDVPSNARNSGFQRATDDLRELNGFNVYRNNSLIAEITDPGTMEYNDLMLPAGDFSYFVKAVYDGVLSDASNVEEVTIELLPPTDLEAVSQGTDVVLNWVAPDYTRSLTGYRVYRDNTQIAEVTETTYTDENLTSGLYVYYVTALYGAYESAGSNNATIQHTHAQYPIIPAETALLGNYPNPFNPITEISFALSTAGRVDLEIYNLKGQKVKTLVSNNMEEGYHSVIWNGKDDNEKQVASGIYFYEMKTNSYVANKKMIMMK
jgi:hypothetical protein